MISYLDHAATTPMRPEAFEAMVPFLTDRFGNPSGAHALGRAARHAIDESRDLVAEALGAEPGDVIFTGGGTESDNLALMGSFAAGSGTIICSAVEHHAVLRCVEALGGRVCPVDTDGVVDLDALESMLDESVTLVSIMLANNEVGAIQPLHKVSRLIKRKAPRTLLHTDAVQAVPWLDVAKMAQFADLISISAHKFGGPQGVGALVSRKGVRLSRVVHGGGQERERRSGTQNVAGIVGMARALESTVADRETTVARIAPLRDHLVDGLLDSVPSAIETGNRSQKIAGNAHLCFPGIEAEALLILLDDGGVCASAGAACSSGALQPSHVLTAMGIPASVASGSLRLSLGHTTTDHEIDVALKVIPDAVARLTEGTDRRPWPERPGGEATKSGTED